MEIRGRDKKEQKIIREVLDNEYLNLKFGLGSRKYSGC